MMKTREEEGYPDYVKKSLRGAVGCMLVGGLVVLVLFVVSSLTNDYAEEEFVTAVVCDKDSVTVTSVDGTSGHEYRVYTNDGEAPKTYVVKDGIVNGVQFNSADIYGQIREGVTYKFTVYGLRIEAASKFEHITAFEEVPVSQQIDADKVCSGYNLNS